MERIDVAAATCEELLQKIPSNGSHLEVRRGDDVGKMNLKNSTGRNKVVGENKLEKIKMQPATSTLFFFFYLKVQLCTPVVCWGTNKTARFGRRNLSPML